MSKDAKIIAVTLVICALIWASVTSRSPQFEIVNSERGTVVRLDRDSGRIDRCIPDNVVTDDYRGAFAHCDGSPVAASP